MIKDPPHDNCRKCRFWNQDPDQTRMNFREILAPKQPQTIYYPQFVNQMLFLTPKKLEKK